MIFAKCDIRKEHTHSGPFFEHHLPSNVLFFSDHRQFNKSWLRQLFTDASSRNMKLVWWKKTMCEEPQTLDFQISPYAIILLESAQMGVLSDITQFQTLNLYYFAPIRSTANYTRINKWIIIHQKINISVKIHVCESYASIFLTVQNWTNECSYLG